VKRAFLMPVKSYLLDYQNINKIFYEAIFYHLFLSK